MKLEAMLKRSRPLALRQRYLFRFSSIRVVSVLFCHPTDEGHEVALPNEANTARATSSTGTNAETAGDVLPLIQTSICRMRMGSTSPVVAMRARTILIGAISCRLSSRALSQYF